MIISDGSDLRRADAKQLQAILRAAPKQPWVIPEGPLEGVVFRATSRFDLRQAQGAVARTLAGAGDLADAAFQRLTAVEAAGPFVRIGSVEGAAGGGPGEWALSHPKSGAVLVDPAARSFVHLGPEHLAQPLMPASLKSDLADWSLDSADGRAVLRLSGRYGLEVHVAQPWRTARSPGDLTIRWTRRSRALVADAWEQVEVPLAEDLESYDVQILDGAVVKRTLTSSTTSILYTAAQQTADWGAPFSPGQTLAIRICQLSNRLGRGDPATVTLQF